VPTLKAYREVCAEALDDGATYAVNSSTGTTVTSLQLSNATANASAQLYDGAYVYIATPPRSNQQRTVRTGGYDPSTGTLTVDFAWLAAPQLLDELFVSRRFPAAKTNPGRGVAYLSLINLALSRLLIVGRLALSVTGQTASVAAYPWLDEGRLLDVLEPGVAGGIPKSAKWRGVNLRLDAETPVLEVPAALAGTQSLTLVVNRPADTRRSTSGVWGDTTDGLLIDTDEAVPPVDDVLKAVLVEAYRVLMHRTPGRPDGNWRPLYASALADARGMNQGRRYPYYDDSGLPAPEQPAATAGTGGA
jgi:hypothetical protein